MGHWINTPPNRHMLWHKAQNSGPGHKSAKQCHKNLLHFDLSQKAEKRRTPFDVRYKESNKPMGHWINTPPNRHMLWHKAQNSGPGHKSAKQCHKNLLHFDLSQKAEKRRTPFDVRYKESNKPMGHWINTPPNRHMLWHKAQNSGPGHKSAKQCHKKLLHFDLSQKAEKRRTPFDVRYKESNKPMGHWINTPPNRHMLWHKAQNSGPGHKSAKQCHKNLLHFDLSQKAEKRRTPFDVGYKESNKPMGHWINTPPNRHMLWHKAQNSGPGHKSAKQCHKKLLHFGLSQKAEKRYYTHGPLN